MTASRGDLLDDGIAAFVCPITNGLFEHPVVADVAGDGRTYSRQAISDWFQGCRERQVPITSPYTRAEMSERLVDNFDMQRAIEEYKEQREADLAAERESRESLASASAAVSTEQSTNPPAKDLSEPGNIFSLLDGLRGLLAETLDGWQPPQLVVVGRESSGKSCVLERLMMTPLLPRDENICLSCSREGDHRPKHVRFHAAPA